MSTPPSAQQLARLAQLKMLSTRSRTQRAAGIKQTQAAPKMSPSQDLGLKYESRAADYLQEQGLHILQRNVRTRVGEIDLVATDKQQLIFVEVRYRASHRYGGALASVNRSKQWRVMRSAQCILPMLSKRYFGGKTPPYRFDVIAIDVLTMHWITNAFGE